MRVLVITAMISFGFLAPYSGTQGSGAADPSWDVETCARAMARVGLVQDNGNKVWAAGFLLTGMSSAGTAEEFKARYLAQLDEAVTPSSEHLAQTPFLDRRPDEIEIVYSEGLLLAFKESAGQGDWHSLEFINRLAAAHLMLRDLPVTSRTQNRPKITEASLIAFLRGEGEIPPAYLDTPWSPRPQDPDED